MNSLLLASCLANAVVGFAFGLRTSSREWRLAGTLGNLVKLILGINLAGIANAAAESLTGKLGVAVAGGLLVGHAFGSLAGSFFPKQDAAKPLSNSNEHKP